MRKKQTDSWNCSLAKRGVPFDVDVEADCGLFGHGG